MLSYIKMKELGDLIIAPVVKVEVGVVGHAQYVKRDETCKMMILSALDDSITNLVMSCSTAEEIWFKLDTIYMQKSEEDVTRLMEEFHSIKMMSGESTSTYIGRIEYITSQLAAANEGLKDSMIISKIISGLPDSYSTFRTSWRAEPNPTLAKLQSRLMAEEKDRGNMDSVALVANSKRSRRRGKNAPSDKGCFNCGMEGHWMKDCKKPKKEKGFKRKNARAHETEAIMAQASYSSQDDNNKIESISKDHFQENHTEVVSYGLDVVESKDGSMEDHQTETNLSEKSSDWILDSEATDHMTHDRSLFVTYNKYSGSRVVKYGGVTGAQRITGIGTIKVESIVENGRTVDLLIQDVLHVPGSRRNLISTCQASEQGYFGWHDSEIYKLVNKKTGKTSLIGKSIGRIFYANIKVLKPECSLSEADELTIWHQRLGHINKDTIRKVFTKEIASDLKGNFPVSNNQTVLDKIDCESCKLSKQVKTAVPRASQPRTKSVGEKLHVDICGPLGAQTISGHEYFILFKDEYSTFRWIHFMKSRVEAFDHIKRCINAIESEFDYKVKKLVSDRGSEFTSNRTQEYLLNKGIVHIVSAPFTPQQNGLIERDNRTVAESTTAMLFHKKLPEYLWGEAANTAIYLLNRTPNSTTGENSPFELFYKRKPKLSHVRIFGCTAMMKVQEEKRSGYQRKLDPRSQKLMLVGYDRDYTYRVFDPDTKKVIISRDVDFDEGTNVIIGSEETHTYESMSWLNSQPDSDNVEHHEEDTEDHEKEDQSRSTHEQNFCSADEGQELRVDQNTQGDLLQLEEPHRQEANCQNVQSSYLQMEEQHRHQSPTDHRV